MTKLQTASIPRFPSTSRSSWPIGSASSVSSKAETETVAKEAAMMSIQPRPPTAAHETRIAIGAARAAPDTSSEMCAAESSGQKAEYRYGYERDPINTTHSQ